VVCPPNSDWDLVVQNPFWKPETQEELEDLAKDDLTKINNNLARKLILSIRRKKGLKVDEKIVDKADKQRTLHRKK